MVKVGCIIIVKSCHAERSSPSELVVIPSEARNLLFAGSAQPTERPNSITMPERFGPDYLQSHSLFSVIRAFTIFFTSASGKGLSDGN